MDEGRTKMDEGEDEGARGGLSKKKEEGETEGEE